MWDEFMDDLRAVHLGAPPRKTGKPVVERLHAAYERARDKASTP
jgi:hypothetical protein